MAKAVQWTLAASGREARDRGKHRTEVTEVTEGDWGLVAKAVQWTLAASGREARDRGKHRTEVTEVTEGGLGIGGESCSVDTRGFKARSTRQGKASHRGHRGHRGGLRLVAKAVQWTLAASGEKHATGESIAQRSQRSQRGIGIGGESCSVDARGFKARSTRQGKASHRGHRGGLGIGGESCSVDARGFKARRRDRGKHRTEVTEATERDWGLGGESCWTPLLLSVCATTIIILFLATVTFPDCFGVLSARFLGAWFSLRSHECPLNSFRRRPPSPLCDL